MKLNRIQFAAALAAVVLSAPGGRAQEPRGWKPLGDGPWIFDTFESNTRIRVSIVAKGLSHPYGMAFLPDGGILVTERPGRLRIIRNGVLDPKPVEGAPVVRAVELGGLLDIALSPNSPRITWCI